MPPLSPVPTHGIRHAGKGYYPFRLDPRGIEPLLPGPVDGDYVRILRRRAELHGFVFADEHG